MYKNNFCPKVAQKKFYLCIIIFGDKIPHNRYRLLAYRPTHTTYPIIPIERHKFSKRHVFHVAWRYFAIAQHDRHVSFRARPVGRRGVSMSSRTRHRRCERSHAIRLSRRFFKAKPFRMTSFVRIIVFTEDSSALCTTE